MRLTSVSRKEVSERYEMKEVVDLMCLTQVSEVWSRVLNQVS
jgi:hypothetical protein